MTRATQAIAPNGGDSCRLNPFIARRWRRPFATFLALWLLLSPTGFVGAAIQPLDTAGAGAALIGATQGTLAATMANAAFIGMASTMTGQLAAGASFGEAFEAGIKAGAISAVTAGVTYGVSDAMGLGYQTNADGSLRLDEAGKAIPTADAITYNSSSAFDKLGDSRFWTMTGAKAVTQGALAEAQGGKFGQGAGNSLAASLGSTFNSAVGDWAKQNDIGGGDLSKVVLHAGIGAVQSSLTGKDALSGAIGAAAAELISPLNDQLDQATGNKLGSELLTVVASAAANELFNKNADLANDLTAISQAQQTDQFNRQLHETEKQRITQLANGDKQKEQRLSAAACSLVKCYAEYPENSPEYIVLRAIADEGAKPEYTAERTLLSQQTGGRNTQLFGYDESWLMGDKGIDALKRADNTYQITTRTLGGLQAVGGATTTVAGAGITSAGAATCAPTTGAGCLAATGGTALTLYGIDQTSAGVSTLMNGVPTQTVGGKFISQMFGVSQETAELIYGVAGLSPAVIEAASINKTANQVAKLSAAAKMSYATEPFVTQGVTITADVMNSPPAKALIAEYVAAGRNADDAFRYTINVISTGKALPVPLSASSDMELIKVVPRGVPVGDTVSNYTPFFMTRQEYDALSRLPAQDVANRLGLPAEQGIRGAQFGFDAYSMKPLSATNPTVFISDTAPVSQGSYSASGGAQQVLVPNRNLWTDPNAKKIGQISGGR